MAMKSSGAADFLPSTLVELLRSRTLARPDERAYTFLSDGDGTETFLTYSELDCKARAIAVQLQSLRASGERALLLYPPGLDFIAAFFGCQYAGVVAVPAYPPRANRNIRRLMAIVADAQAAFILSTSAVLSAAKAAFASDVNAEALTLLATDTVREAYAPDWSEPEIGSQTLAFMQYTSGSTGKPKGAMLSHGNLLHNASLVHLAMEHSPSDRYVSWLPTFHDMGFMAGVLQPLYAGIPVVLMSPAAFLQKPARWLEAISKYRATTSGGPNFAYDLCVRRIGPEQRASLDLSSWTVAFNGAEPIREETIERFTTAFGPCGFRRETFYPCYGLAEATLIVSGGRKHSAPVIQWVEGKALESSRAVLTSAGANEAKPLVACGLTLSDQKIVVANHDSLTRCAPGEIGEILVSGASVAQGYWNRVEETAATFHAYLKDSSEGPFLRTGDLGFIHEGELFVTGRLKDLIIIRGRNHYPQDIELTAERSHPSLRPGCGAAFSIDADDEERLVVVQEIDRNRVSDLDAVINAIRLAIADNHELHAHAVVLIKHGTISKTSSGKIQRHAVRAAFIAGTLEVVKSSFTAESPAEAEASGFSRELYSTADEPARAEILSRYLREEVARVLRSRAPDLDPRQPLNEFGIDSLASIELKHSIDAELGVGVSLAALLGGASIEQLALVLRDELSSSSRQPQAATPGIATGETLSYGQRALWFLQELDPSSTAYNIAVAVRLRGHIDVDALRHAFRALGRRHSSLRSSFPAISGKPVRRVEDDVQVGLVFERASDWNEEQLRTRLSEEAHRPFELRNGPLMRTQIFERAADDHVLLLVVHHIIADFWSFAVLVDELARLYSGATLLATASDYINYVAWQERMLASAEGKTHQAFWKSRLEGELPALNLAADLPRPKLQTYQGASRAFYIDADLAGKLNRLAQSGGSTLYMTLLASFQALLARYTGQEDILVGSPTAGRSRPEMAGVVGYFVNPIVMRSDLSGNPAFSALLEQVRRSALAAFEHADYPFALLVEQLQPDRDPSRSPLFQAMFVLYKSHILKDEALASFALGESGSRLRLGELVFESMSIDNRVAQFDLTLMAAEVDGRLAASVQYNTDLFDAATIERMAGHFERLLQSIVETPDARLADLQILSAAERFQLLSDWNRTERDYPAKSLHGLFEEQVDRSPDAVAIVFERALLTYSELNRRSNQLAHYLLEIGAGPEVPVGICMTRTPEIVIALIGVLKAGASYVPLDPSYPGERVAFMLQDSQAGAVVSQKGLSETLSSTSVRLVLLDADSETIARRPGDNPERDLSPDNAAYIIYTSGSTGVPKGVVIQHSSAAAFMHWTGEVFTSDDLDGVLASTSICFDLSVFELFGPLSWGGKIVLVENALAIPALESASQVRFINTVPSAMAELLRSGSLPPAINTVGLAGEALPRNLADDIYRSLGVDKLYNLYGPSEDTTYSTYALVEPYDPQSPPIGRPISNTRTYILGGKLEPVPAGVAGELYIAGEGLARGYLNRPGVTAERFIPCQFGEQEGARCYKTGDLARYRSDGNIEYLGRIDHQVKIRGFRIELGEIEVALTCHPAVKDAVVIAQESRSGKRLVAYLACDAEHAPEVKTLRVYLKERLPEYMVPAVFVVLEQLPLQPNGKIDRKALPDASVAGSTPDHGLTALAPVAELLASIWCDVLGVEASSAGDNFFELGGHSLLATQVASRIRGAFGVELPLRRLFELPTLGELSGAIEDAMRAGKKLETPPILPVSRTELLPLSFAQQRLWFIEQLEPGRASYNIPGAVHIRGSLELNALEQSFAELIRRHESLRTTFRHTGERPVQFIAPDIFEALQITDISNIEEAYRQSAAFKLAIEQAQKPFDLEFGPLFKTRLIRITPEESLLVIVLHHAIADGWSMGILVKELGALYESFAAGGPSSLEELRIQYADFASWQRRWFDESSLESEMAYWRNQLAGEPDVLNLPSDRPRPAAPSHRGAQYRFLLSTDLKDRLHRLGRRESATTFMLLLAGLKALLYRYTSLDQIVVGTSVANRNRAEIEPLIGCFVNNLVLKTALGGELLFHDLIDRVREVSLGAFTHQELPFERLVEELAPERDLSRNPLFQIVFVLQSAPLDPLRLKALTVESVDLDNGTSKLDLSLSMQETGAGLCGEFEYSTDLFDLSTIERLAGHFVQLLATVTSNPETPLWKIDFLTEAERYQLTEEWALCESSHKGGGSLHRLIESVAEAGPERLAVVFEDHSLTYDELDQRANQLAHYLRRNGVRECDLVAVCMDRSVEMVTALLGILKAGAAYVPIDSSYPRDRIAFMLDDSQAALVLTQHHLVDLVIPSLTEVLCLDSDWSRIAIEDLSNPQIDCPPGVPAYVIYTSGSTGRPKGVMVSHGAILNTLQWRQARYPLEPGDRVIQKIPVAFDPSVWEIFAPLLSGATVVMGGANAHREMGDLIRLIIENDVTNLQLPPAALQVFLREPALDQCRNLKQVISGGERMPFELKEEFLAKMDASLDNLYGPTEAALEATHWRCRRSSGSSLVPIGKPIANAEVYLLDAAMQPVPAGVPGELYVGGDGLAVGYLGRPDLTAERFVPNSVNEEPGARLYRTGDLGKHLRGGDIDFLGRIDHQVKIRGIRIEPAEIETALAEHPLIGEAVVIAREDLADDKRLIAYVVAANGRASEGGPRPLDANQLRIYSRERLPEFMVPSVFVIMEQLPRTPNGKVDHRALPQPVSAEDREAGSFAGPRTPIEELLAVIWSSVLGIERIGVNDNFFDIGGHSLLATQVTSRARQAFGIELPIRRLFESPTISELARVVEDAIRTSQPLIAPPVIPVSRDVQLPLSFGQQRLWFIDHLEPGSASYNMPGVVRLKGKINIQALEQCWNELIRRHEIMRTRFVPADGRGAQVIDPFEPGALKLVDLADQEKSLAEAAAVELAIYEARRPFDLAAGETSRICLLRLSANEALLTIVMHHIVSDGWSMGILINELGALFRDLSAGVPVHLEDLRVQYGDFAVWQRDWFTGTVLDSQLEYWKEQLSGELALIELPTDRPRPSVQTYRGDTLGFVVPDTLRSTLETLSKDHGVTLFMTMLAAFKMLLHRYTGQEDIIVGTPIANRNRAEIEDLIGFFVNNLVLRTRLEPDLTFNDLLLRVRETSLAAYAHQDLPFERLVDALDLDRDLSRSPIFQVLFIMQNTPGGRLELPEMSLSVVEVNSGTAKYDLTLSIQEIEHGLAGSIEYNTDLFDEQTIGRVAAHFKQLLATVGCDPNCPIWRINMLSEAEQQELIEGFNTTAVAFDEAAPVHRVFEQQAGLVPDRIAVISGDTALTYDELNSRANMLARYLRSAGIDNGDLVGICLNRSIEISVALIGTLKAGGAYVPLDPGYPVERLTYMIEDSKLKMLLAEKGLIDSLPQSGYSIICLDQDWPEIAVHGSNNFNSEAPGEALAYVIYTSGSTGKPKGVQVRHIALTNFLLSMSEEPGLSADDVFLSVTTLSFDIAGLELFLPLMLGARLNIVSREIAADGYELARALQTSEATSMQATPATWRLLLEAGWRGDPELKALCGGEALPPDLADQLRSCCGSLWNMYGPTETTIWSALSTVKPREVIRIGRPIANTVIYVLDRRLELVPVGVAGELYIGGDGLARGYLDRPDLTADRFIADPFKAGERIYKTGDLARYGADGQLEYLGRIDHQVKIRGHRIETAEVESVLSLHGLVREAVVVARPDGFGNNLLVAYLAPNTEAIVSTKELRSFLKQKLPEYMIPSAFVVLQNIPLTPNGKVDRRALPAPDGLIRDRETSFVAPRTPVEELLAAIWSDVLGIDSVGVHDNFFELGGDSIRSIQVKAKAQQSGVSFTLQQLFQHQTVFELSRVLGTADSTLETIPSTETFSLVSPDDRLKMPPDVEDAYPMAMLQAGMLFHSEYSPDTAVYHDILSFHLRAPLDDRSLRIALEKLVSNQASLRTSFHLTGFSQPMQLVHRRASIPAQVEDLRHLTESEQDEELARFTETEKRQKFDCTRTPLMRVWVHRRSEESFQFTLSFHHVILDGWSVATMLTGLFHSYISLVDGTEEAEENLPPSSGYRDFVALERAALESEEARSFWSDELRGIELVELPRLGDAESFERQSEVRVRDVQIADGVSEGLRRMARQAHVPIKSVLLAAHLKVMSLLAGRCEVVTGLVLNGRPEQDGGDRVLGLFLNTVPLRHQLNRGPWSDLARAAFDKERQLLPYRRYPLGALQRLEGGQPLFETAFSFTHFHVHQSLDSLSGVQVLSASGFAQTNFTLIANFNLDVATSRVRLHLDYDAAKLREEQIDHIAEYYERALGAVSADPAGNYESCTLLPERERLKQLSVWNNTKTAYPGDKCIHELFEQVVAATPDTVAVSFADSQMSYDCLNRRSNQLARTLRRYGVAAETPVGIATSRSPEMIIGLLAILKAGGAYFPLDPAYPAERLEFMLQDAGLELLLTEQSLAHRFDDSGIKMVTIDSDWEQIAAESDANPVCTVTPDNIAYVDYTSGSTGTPKGVEVRHRGVGRLLFGVDYVELNSSSRLLHLSPISFDASTFEVWGGLLHGGRCVLMGERMISARELEEVIKREGVETMWLTSSLYNAVVDERVEALEGVKQLLIGGEALSVEHVLKGQRSLRGTEIINGYGPTESTTFACCYRTGEGRVEGAKRIPIGSPIGNTTVYLMNEEMELAPAGVTGEMYIGGDGLARGYLNRAELTAERFMPDPTSEEGGGRLYKTGDLGRYLEDGRIEFVGRRDHQVKIRGYRIELGEIEAVLEKHPRIESVIVEVREEEAGDKRLVAYVVGAEAERPTVSELRSYLKERLPEFMTPHVFVFIDVLPLNPNGKVDRSLLPQLPQDRPNLESSFVAPRNEWEETIARIFCEVLGLERVGVFDNFFDLGGHSLLATQAVSKVREELNGDLPLRCIFETPTVADLASLVGMKPDANGVSGDRITSIQRSDHGLDELLLRINELSDEDVAAMLGEATR